PRGQLELARDDLAGLQLTVAEHVTQRPLELRMEWSIDARLAQRCRQAGQKPLRWHANVRTFTNAPMPRSSSHSPSSSSRLAAVGRRAAGIGALRGPPCSGRSRSCHESARLLAVLLLYVVLRPVMGLGHEVTVAGVAWLAHALVGTGWWMALIGWLGLDPI